MTGFKMALVYLFMFNFAMFGITTSTVQLPGVTNPICDLYTGYCQGNQLGLVSGTTSGILGQDSGVVSPQQQSAQSCGLGGLIGGGIGAIGFVLGPVGIATTVLGGLAGCYISSTFFPTQGSNLVQQFSSTLGPVGQFLQAVIAVLSYVNPIIKFIADSISYELSLFSAAPEIGVWLFPLQGVWMLMLFVYIAEYFRGTGTVSA